MLEWKTLIHASKMTLWRAGRIIADYYIERCDFYTTLKF